MQRCSVCASGNGQRKTALHFGLPISGWTSETAVKENSKEAAKEIIGELVNRFAEQEQSYLNSAYNETQTRRDFIDPFFSALGWDMDNSQGFAEAYREVIHEDKIAVQGALKSPDYCFTVYGQKKFYVEAKRPSILIKDAPEPAFQVRRYGWSAKLPVSILTDFQEFAVYDCTSKPGEKDQAASARIKYITYRDYLNEFDYLWDHFSKEGVLKGRFDQFAKDAEKKRGTTTPDDAFLQSLDEWRKELAEKIALRNEVLTEEEINFAVQAILDRIIFLRISEDRGFEPFGSLRDTKGSYAALHQLFQAADQKYNSGLFDLKKDAITPNLNIDADVLKRIFKGLYYPAPYVFSEMPVEILGNAYEQFLGKVIRLTKGHHAKIEEKPEVRKAGGVYYTPRYIVDYIVKHAVGPLFEGKKPAEVAEIRVLDPACGSGSFLLGAYEFLLEWYLNAYRDTPAYKKQHASVRKDVMRHSTKGNPLTPDGRLTIAEKKRILLAHLFGVDIDPQAVEVTKLSLLTKMLENENGPSLKAQQELFHERVLPDLDGNIKCGNSLIGSDFYGLDFEPGAEKKIKPFDWEKEYPAVFKAGGFDAVIGNPPYFSIDDTWGVRDPRQLFLRRHYSEVYTDKSDILFYFFVLALRLSKDRIGFIVSRAFLEAYKAAKLRAHISAQSSVEEIVDFRNYYVFKGVGITSAIVVLNKSTKKTAEADFFRMQERAPLTIIGSPESFTRTQVKQELFGQGIWSFAEGLVELLFKKIDAAGEPMSSFLHLGQGMQTGANTVFGNLTMEEVKSWRLSPGRFFKRARNSDIERYHIKPCSEIVLYLEDYSSFQELPVGVQEYLKGHASVLKNRAAFKRGDCEWWRFTWPLHKDYYDRKRIICPYLAKSNRFALDESRTFLGLTDTTVIFDNGQPEDLKYILGLLNSRLLTFRFAYMTKLKSGGILEFLWNSLGPLSIRRINRSIADKKAHDTIVKHVETMLQLHKDLQSATLPHDKEQIQRRIEHTDRQIDALVYELYGLTEEEIRIVEGK